MKAMILAAGKGERLRPLTLTTPKPLLSINGKPMIVSHIEHLARIGIKDIVINHAWLGQKIEAFLEDGSQWGVNIIYLKEQKAFGTGGGIKNALSLLGENPFIMISADIVTNYPFEHLQQMKLKPGILGHLSLITNPYHHPQGDYCLNNGTIIHKQPDLPALTFASIALLSPALFMDYPATTFSIAAPFDKAINADQLTGEHFTGYHRNVDTLERLEYAKKEQGKMY